MAPLPDSDDHYDAGAPLDGGASPAVLGGDNKHFQPTGLEIGVITGVAAIVLITVVGIFVWRARKNRFAKNATVLPSGTATVRSESSSQPAVAQETTDPIPPPKDDHFNTVKTEDLSSFEQPNPLGSHRPDMKWNQWVGLRRGGEEQVQEHEIVNRV